MEALPPSAHHLPPSLPGPMMCSMILASDVAKAIFPQSRNLTKRPWLRRYRAAASATVQRRVKSNSLLGAGSFPNSESVDVTCAFIENGKLDPVALELDLH